MLRVGIKFSVINFNRSVVVNSYYVDDNDDSYTRTVKVVLNPEVWMNSALRVAYHNSVCMHIILLSLIFTHISEGNIL